MNCFSFNCHTRVPIINIIKRMTNWDLSEILWLRTHYYYHRKIYMFCIFSNSSNPQLFRCKNDLSTTNQCWVVNRNCQHIYQNIYIYITQYIYRVIYIYVIFKNPILVNNHSSQKTRTEGSLVFNFSKNWNQRLQLN